MIKYSLTERPRCLKLCYNNTNLRLLNKTILFILFFGLQYSNFFFVYLQKFLLYTPETISRSSQVSIKIIKLIHSLLAKHYALIHASLFSIGQRTMNLFDFFSRNGCARSESPEVCWFALVHRNALPTIYCNFVEI